MIQVTLEPTELIVDQPNDLTIWLTNTGRETVTNILCRLALPVKVVLLKGLNRIEVPQLDPAQEVRHTIRVLPKSVGTWVLTSPNFSYRDGFGRVQRNEDLHLEMTVVKKELPSPPPEADIKIQLRTTELPLNQWEKLEGVVSNVGAIALQNIKVSASGRVECDADASLGGLPAGKAKEFCLSVCAFERGSNVPISIEVTYTDNVGRTGHRRKSTPLRVTEAHPVPEKSTSQAVRQEQDTQTQKILILAAIPHGLRLDREIREIEEAIRRAARREQFETKIRTAVRTQDIRRAIAEEKPQIVHFCGHGIKDGSLILEDDGGQNKPVKPEGLAALFRLHADYVNCVLLNACHTEKPAEAISQHINYAIGMNQGIKDRAAIVFAQGFYDALGYEALDNQDLFPRAFEEGLVAIQLEGLPGEQTPVMKRKLSARG